MKTDNKSKLKRICKVFILAFLICFVGGIFTACSDEDLEIIKKLRDGEPEASTEIASVTEEYSTEEKTTEKASEEGRDEKNAKESDKGKDSATKTDAATSGDAKKENPRNKILISLDPGHQSENVDMSALEPNAPGSDTMKAKASTGTQGRFTGVPEYKLNLDIALQVRDKLTKLGYKVIMTRENNDTAISNMERACLANEAGADISIRIHANGVDNSSVSGALALVGSASNPYVGNLYDESYRLAETVLDEYTKATGFSNQGITTDDSMTGINWSEIPVMILEMGYMTNEYDDTMMQDTDFQKKMVDGIVSGIEAYYDFPEPGEETEENGAEAKGRSVENISLSEKSVQLKSDAEEYLENVRAEGSLCSAYMKNLTTGEVIDLSTGKQKAASIIKLFVAGAVYKHYDELLEDGYSETEIEDLVSVMISVSDNDATNTLVKMLGYSDPNAGMEVVNSFIESCGYTESRMGRLMLDFDSDGENYVDAREIGEYLERLYKGNEIKGSDKIISYMKQQEYTEKIPSVLPWDVTVANKTGDLVDVDNDSAIVYGDKADYIICVFADELTNTSTSRNTILKISELTYDCWE